MALTGPDLPKIPQPLKNIQQYLTIAAKHDQRDNVVSYWCKYISVNVLAMKIFSILEIESFNGLKIKKTLKGEVNIIYFPL